LAPPPALPKLPATLAQAQNIAASEHPSIRASQYGVQAAEFDVIRARGAKKPTVGLGANVTYGVNTQVFGDDQVSGSLSLNGNMPLLDGGANSSLVRQSLSILDRRKAELQDTARSVEQDTAIAWANLNVARASIRSSRQQIRAARIAFDGIQEEAKLGARTTLDVLDAEQEVLNAESGLAAALRDEYVAAYNLVSSMGLLNTQYLKLGIEPYDPNAYYQSVNKKPLTREGTALGRINDRWNN
jgi:outer membrane protein